MVNGIHGIRVPVVLIRWEYLSNMKPRELASLDRSCEMSVIKIMKDVHKQFSDRNKINICYVPVCDGQRER